MVLGAALKQSVFVVAAKRTPFGTFGGTLKGHTATDLTVHAANAALASANLSADKLSSVVVGNVLSCSATDTPYISRHVALRVGAKEGTPALTVNRLCGSGFQSVVNGVQEILLGDSEVVLAAGADNMSAAPYALRNIRFGTKLGVDNALEDMMWASLTDAYIKTPMGVTAENLGAKYGLSRQEVDDFALRSQHTWGAAQEAGVFADEMAPMEVKGKKRGETRTMDTDEHPKPQTKIEGLAKLPPVFKKDGVVTAGSASGICDGAGALILASEDAVKANGLTPLARVVGYGLAGCDPKIMGIGPVPAIRAMLEKTGKSLGEIDFLEINEAFGAQALACLKELGYPMEKFNTCGGAIALGHPLAASGSRISAHLVHKMRQNADAKLSIGSACIGGGQGIAVLFEKC